MGKALMGGLWKRSKRTMALVFVGAALAIAAIPAAAVAWMSWDGIDPVIDLGNGSVMNIYVEWPTEMTCDVDPLIRVRTKFPQNLTPRVVAESATGFPCNGTTYNIATVTEVDKHSYDQNIALVRVDLDADQKTPVRVLVSMNGAEVAVLEGTSNGWVTGMVPLS